MSKTAAEQIRQLLQERILILDGAMGTMIQRHGLDEAGYRGERFADHSAPLKGCNDLLSVVRPDVIVDLRPESPSYRRWVGVELDPVDHNALYVPEGCATGYMTLADDTEMYYHTTAAYAPDHATGVRFDDPAFGIDWPIPDPSMLDRDRDYPDFIPESSPFL